MYLSKLQSNENVVLRKTSPENSQKRKYIFLRSNNCSTVMSLLRLWGKMSSSCPPPPPPRFRLNCNLLTSVQTQTWQQEMSAQGFHVCLCPTSRDAARRHDTFRCQSPLPPSTPPPPIIYERSRTQTLARSSDVCVSLMTSVTWPVWMSLRPPLSSSSSSSSSCRSRRTFLFRFFGFIELFLFVFFRTLFLIQHLKKVFFNLKSDFWRFTWTVL